VLRVGELPAPRPSGGEVRVAVSLSGASPGDTKKREGWRGSPMPYPRVIPHSDAAGIIDAVGTGVDDARIGKRVWVFGAQSYRPFGTAAQLAVLPDAQAIELPDQVSDEIGAALGLLGITAHRAVFSDGPVTGKVVLVQGVLGAVGSLAAQLASWGGATVIGTVLHAADLAHVDRSVVPHAVALDQRDPANAIREHAPAGVDRIVEVALSDNGELDASVVANDAVMATYFSRADRIDLPFSPPRPNRPRDPGAGPEPFP
jgi:NADPH:quinone reductase